MTVDRLPPNPDAAFLIQVFSYWLSYKKRNEIGYLQQIHTFYGLDQKKDKTANRSDGYKSSRAVASQVPAVQMVAAGNVIPDGFKPLLFN